MCCPNGFFGFLISLSYLLLFLKLDPSVPRMAICFWYAGMLQYDSNRLCNLNFSFKSFDQRLKSKIRSLVIITSLRSQASQSDHLHILNLDSRHTLETEILKLTSRFTLLNFTLFYLKQTNTQELFFLGDHTKRCWASIELDRIWP